MKNKYGKLTFKEMEYLMAIMHCRGSVYANVFLYSLRDFSGGSLGNIEEIDDCVISRLVEKGMIEIIRENGKDVYKVTNIGVGSANEIVKKNWQGDDNFRRWRKVFFNGSDHSKRAHDEEVIMGLLLDWREIETKRIRLYVENVSTNELESLAENHGFDYARNQHKIVRGEMFPQIIAKMIHAKENSGNYKQARLWKDKVQSIANEMVNADVFLGNEWKRRYDEAYQEALLNSCPIGLSEKCSTEFKGDADCLLPQKHLSMDDLQITIKAGFAHQAISKRSKYKLFTSLILAEILQREGLTNEEQIVFRRKIEEMETILRNALREFDFVQRRTGINFAKRASAMEIGVTCMYGAVTLRIPVLARDKRNKIGSLTCEEIELILIFLEKQKNGANSPDFFISSLD